MLFADKNDKIKLGLKIPNRRSEAVVGKNSYFEFKCKKLLPKKRIIIIRLGREANEIERFN